MAEHKKHREKKKSNSNTAVRDLLLWASQQGVPPSAPARIKYHENYNQIE